MVGSADRDSLTAFSFLFYPVLAHAQFNCRDGQSNAQQPRLNFDLTLIYDVCESGEEMEVAVLIWWEIRGLWVDCRLCSILGLFCFLHDPP